MVRSLAVLMFALALSAQAQDAEPSNGGPASQPIVGPAKASEPEAQKPVLLTSTTRLESQPAKVLPANTPVQPNEGVGTATTPNAWRRRFGGRLLSGGAHV